MKKISLFAVLALGLSPWAAGTEFPRNSKLQVCAQIEFWDGKSSVWKAEQLANLMFATAGVKINWRNVDLQQEHRPCSARQDWQIIVRLATGASASIHPGALAFSQLDEGVFIDVFFDRVVQIANSNAPENRVLAHVLVHEITHLIQGLNRHSSDGVMEAKWSRTELTRMKFKPLPFTPEDIRLIHLGLANWPPITPPRAELVAPNLKPFSSGPK